MKNVSINSAEIDNISSLNLKPRLYSALFKANIRTVGQLKNSISDGSIRFVHDVGKGSIKMLKEKLMEEKENV